ncbi:NAD(P)/FAD-dependent oxidoreductase [Tuwongella immobilis]|uniref:Uncharacterized protein n=1 Tax=Tuwongella immobilis TaxID=692036 RepID=A0A6C2YPK1_9BACT|nr:FAD-dependent oxidoreductase [Tuwongella immobilis]VIP03324.1 fad dependent oxidoreductase : FAD-dependent dehydrogenase OS=Singulisphaera acidiphila (strain ATCC BAA-1392 / DSM 18658 / VKM B-2454 / MOB10) GN=Sinac_3551 PE=4 SV=1: NAD_binding_8: DAO [Tuwongella immobilis]VTS04019.1 fad dependent oxidoreductase : FAD-dependent dehydrogenase OS=Singulisphaera acidiphila (strain ATCC BAA-1392 / DSM 18658 / VKM B-2454 / MOB10) GN=Sinac_3551 PE=4 SV=1: NAD_binding_8: DAO [Tuwongella immobilis]
MTIRISNLRLPIEDADSILPNRLARILGVSPEDLRAWRILRKSLDVRDKRSIHFVYNAAVDLPEDEATVVARSKAMYGAQVALHDEPAFEMPTPGELRLRHRPIVLGSGPGGLVAAYFLALEGYCPLVLERGTRVNERIRDVRTFDDGGEFNPNSNYLFGEGGAGTFSDGKLTCRGTGPDVQRVLELFAECKGKPSILYEHRPHLGSNRLPAVVKAIRQRIEAMGGEVRFHCPVEDLLIEDGKLVGVVTPSGRIDADLLVLAPGHSARDTYEMLVRTGVPLVQKPFQMGVRIEHPQDQINRVQYGSSRAEEQLGNADYSLIANGPRGDVFTFCMCAGGYIIPSVSEEGYFCTNGMSLSKRDSPHANSGLVVTVPLSEFPGTDVLAGVRLQQKYERIAFELGRGEYRCPVQRASDFVAGKASRETPYSSYPREKISIDLREVLPPYIAAALADGLPMMDRRWHGKFLRNATLAGPEARGSSPIRILRDDLTRETPGLTGIFPVGEGAGYAGGIVSAAVDGLRTAKAIVARYARLDRSNP